MTDLWTPTPERERVNFSECEILVEEQTSSKGTTYNKITLNLFPLAGGDLISDSYFKFQNHSKPWDSDVLPAIRELVTAGKLANAPDISGKYVSWCFRQWRSYRKNDVQYWRDRAETERLNGQEEDAQKSAGKIQIDERGNEFVEKRYIHILDVFNSQEEAEAASNEHYGVEDSTSGVWDGAKKESEPPTGFDDKSSAMLFLPEFVKMATVNDVVDTDKLANLIESSDVLKAHFTIESNEVKQAIINLYAKLQDEKDDLPF